MHLKNFLLTALVTILFFSCTKGPGEGGKSIIRGKIYAYNYNTVGTLVGEGYSQQLGRIDAVMPHQVGDAVGESARLAAAGTGHHQQRTLMVVHRLALGVVEAGEEAHASVLPP